MTKLRNPLISLDARGRIGKLITLTRRQKVNIAEKMPIPHDLKSPAQLSWRHMFLKVVALWHALSSAEKQAWESSARRHNMTGYAWFLSQALRPNPGIYLPLQGGVMAGDIDMDSNKITGLPLPDQSHHAATKEYVDTYASFLGLTDTPADYAGEALKVARVNAGENALEFATVTGGYTEGARVYHNVDQSIPNGTLTALAFNSERWDTDTIHDPATNNSRLTSKTAGKYLAISHFMFAGNATGQRNAWIRLNGSTYWTKLQLSNLPTIGPSILTTTIFDLSINDYIEIFVWQNSGGPLIVRATAFYTPEFMIQRIG